MTIFSFFKKNYKITISFTVFILSITFLIWRAKYGFCYNDEPFCVTLAQRLYNGDALITSEWHGAQNFGTIILPLFAIYKALFNTTEGILIFLRYFYCILWFLTCLWVFFTLKKNYFAALITFVFLILFSPLDYMTVSYTSVSLMCILLLCCLIYRSIGNNKLNLPIFSLLFSLLNIIITICIPYYSIIFLLTIIIAALTCIFKRKTNSDIIKKIRYVTIFSFVFVSVTLAVYLYIFLFSKTSLKHIITNLPYIMQDPEHGPMSFFDKIITILRVIYHRSPIFIYSIILSTFIGFFPKLIKLFRIYIFFIASLIFCVMQYKLCLNINNNLLNYQVADIAFLGFAAFMLLIKKPYKLFFVFYPIGMIYTICFYFTSNTGYMAVSMCLCVCAAVGIIFIFLLCKEMYLQYHEAHFIKHIAVALCVLVLSFQLSCEIYTRLTRQYLDDNFSTLQYTINVGCAKGLKTSVINKTEYENCYNNLKYLLGTVETKNKSFLSCTSGPYIYLDAGMKIASFSAWTFGYGDNLNKRLNDYYALNPEKQPDIIFCLSKDNILPIINSDYKEYYYNGSYLFVKLS